MLLHQSRWDGERFRRRRLKVAKPWQGYSSRNTVETQRVREGQLSILTCMTFTSISRVCYTARAKARFLRLHL